MSKQIKYFDIHSHVFFPEYDLDRDEVIKRALEQGIGMINVGTDMDSSKKAIKLAETYENIWATVGIHPNHNTEIDGDIDYSVLLELAKHPKVVAIGECGLDFFRSKEEEIPKQIEMFEQHIKIANVVSKPLMLHVRNKPTSLNSDSSLEMNAYQEAIKLLKDKAKVKANFHFFAGSLEDMQDIVANGNSVSFTGVLTFARNYDEVVKSVPSANFMSETDCPFVAPIPYRGKRNEPSYVIEVIKKLAEIRGESFDFISEQLLKNARSFFKLD